VPKKNNAPPITPTCHPERKHIAKGLCKQCHDLQYDHANRDKRNRIAREWAKNHPDRVAATRVRSRYGLELDQVAARLNAQDGLCKICRRAKATDIDHDHVTGVARSILCGDCNRALGLLKEDRQTITRMLDYLNLWDSGAPEPPVGFAPAVVIA
jgi:hypothetical protein